MALPRAELTDKGVVDARAGRRVFAEDFTGMAGESVHAWFSPTGALIALGSLAEDGTGRVVRGFTLAAT